MDLKHTGTLTNVPCTMCATQNLVQLVGIRLTLCHQVLDDVEAAIAGSKEDGSGPILLGSPFCQTAKNTCTRIIVMVIFTGHSAWLVSCWGAGFL